MGGGAFVAVRAARHLTREDLAGKIIDVHSHVGVSLKAYGLGEYPYAQTIEGLAYRQDAGPVDANVVFPFTADLYFEPTRLMDGEMVPARNPISKTPYGLENRLLMREVFRFCPELSSRFLPFVSVDPARAVHEQIAELEALDREFPIYGIKVNPTGCQSKASELLGDGGPLLDFAEERNMPLTFHVTTLSDDPYSQASDTFRIVESRPGLRFCLAHCLLFNKGFLERAQGARNVWVDTAAMKIQVDLVRGLFEGEVPRSSVIDADYSDHVQVMRTLCEMFPETIVWGTDSPAYSYICTRRSAPLVVRPERGRKEGEGGYRSFNYKARYEDEIAALEALAAEPGGELRMRVGSSNALDFVFGREE